MKYFNFFQKKNHDEKPQKPLESLITNAISSGFLLLSENFKITFHNEKALYLFSIKNINDFNFLQLFRNEKLENALKRLTTGEKSSLEIKKENCILEVEISKIEEGYVIFVSDITNEVRSKRLKRELGANIGHVLKTPLTSILGFAELINNDMVSDTQIKDFTKKIEKEARRVIHLVEDIIKFEELNLTSAIEEIDIREKVNYVLEMFEQNISKKELSITVEGDLRLKIQHIHIIEILTNIIDNAIKYNVQNGTIKISLSESKIEIEDSGIGIKKELLQNIFERFYRIPNNKISGNGLGLSIVYEIAKLYNFKVYAESSLNKGTKFTIAL